MVPAVEPPGAPAFSGVEVDPALLYGAGWNLVTGPAWTPPLSPRVSRSEAMSVPAVKRARDLICNAIGTLPLELIGPDDKPADPQPQLLTQPEVGVPGSVTWSNVVEDLLFEKVSWLRVTATDWRQRPAVAVRLDPRTVTVQQDMRVYYSRTGNGTALEWLPDDQLIRIDSPNDALLRAGSRAIRSLLRLEAAAANYADGAPPVDFFTPAEGADPVDDEDVADLLTAWKTGRRNGGTGYVPAALKYNVGGFNPEQLQLAQAREFAITEIARLTGVDSEELGVSTTSRTYFNAFDRKQNFIQFTLTGYLTAIEQRLSMDDVTPRGYRVRFNLDSFFKADTLSRYQAYQVGLQTGAITADEVRAAEGKPALTAAQRAELKPAPAPAPAAQAEEVPA